jgi:hypothetical protein
MSKQSAMQRRWKVQRTFEPNRLSADILAQAYQKIVSQRVRVIHFTTDGLAEPNEPDEQLQVRSAS